MFDEWYNIKREGRGLSNNKQQTLQWKEWNQTTMHKFFLINTKKHAIPELALSDAEWNEQTQLSYIQQIKSIYLLNVKIAYQCIKKIFKQKHKEKKKNWKETKTSLRKNLLSYAN